MRTQVTGRPHSSPGHSTRLRMRRDSTKSSLPRRLRSPLRSPFPSRPHASRHARCTPPPPPLRVDNQYSIARLFQRERQRRCRVLQPRPHPHSLVRALLNTARHSSPDLSPDHPPLHTTKRWESFCPLGCTLPLFHLPCVLPPLVQTVYASAIPKGRTSIGRRRRFRHLSTVQLHAGA